ncbi:MAG TPA: CPBP family intramembrane glutamic endopeptidase [Oceanipulchritudo sp.]|nr:CPBP family intramembrane glutamic endopeptidase [Oceanipulchritudo sp.]
MPSRAERASIITSALLVILFSYFLHQSRPAALACLVLFLMLLLQWIWKAGKQEINRTFGFHGCAWHWLLALAVLGVGLALRLRWYEGYPVFPTKVSPFLVMAALIGLTEELVFRGYFYGRWMAWSGWGVAVVMAAVLHTAYKVALLASSGTANLVFLGSVTLIAGLVLGLGRKVSGSIWPCVVFHVAFDICVYGDRPTPWWIW